VEDVAPVTPLVVLPMGQAEHIPARIRIRIREEKREEKREERKERRQTRTS
jgi:hypothetical protein